MGRTQSFEEFLASRAPEIPLLGFVINLVLAAILAGVLAIIYVRWGKSLSNRKVFARIFTILTVTTMLIITIVKSSLALSLGLVGALSIVRFRTALKEPEELVYLFLCIGIGLGFGANQTVITIVGFSFVCCLILLRAFSGSDEAISNLHLTVTSSQPGELSIGSLTEVLDRHCSMINLKRLDDEEESFEASYLIEFKQDDGLQGLTKELRALPGALAVSFLDSEGLI